MKSHPVYEILEEIGQGTSATVYRARDLALKRDVAIKELHERLQKDPRQMEQFWQEAQFLAGLRHDNIVQVYALDKERGWIILELMQGSLDARSAAGPLPADMVRSILRQTLQALEALHDRDKLHAAIKPGNLLIDAEGRVKVSDSSGIAIGGEFRKPEGSPKYLAPELLNPQFGEVGPGVDLYALGLTALELLKVPDFDGLFKGVGPEAIDPDLAWMRWHSAPGEKLPPVREIIKGLPEDLARVIDRLLKKKVQERYSSAREALRDLEDKPLVLVDPVPPKTAGKAAAPTGPAVVPIGQQPIQPPRPAAPPPRAPSRPAAPRPAVPRPAAAGPGPKPWSREWLNKQLEKKPVLYTVLALIILPTLIYFFSEPEKMYQVAIASKPSQATLYVDGKKTETPTDCTVPLGPGKHRIKLELDGHEPLEREIVVKDAKKTHQHVFELVRAAVPRRIVVESDPPGALIFFDGVLQPRVTGQELDAPPLPYKLQVQLKGYRSYESMVRTVEEEKRKIVLEPEKPLPPALVELQIRTDPPGAEVHIDGKKQEKRTDGSFLVPNRPFDLKLVLKGFETLQRKVEPGTALDRLILTAVPRPPRRLAVKTDPPGAEVFIDGKKAGQTDGTFEVPDGSFEVRLVLKGYLEIVRKVDPKDLTLVVRLETAPPPTRIVLLQTDPPGAEVYVNDKLLGKTNGKFEVPAGPYRLKLVMPGKETVEKAIDPKKEKDDVLTFRLVPRTFPVVLRTLPGGAGVVLDGVSQEGKTPLAAKLTAGKHEVTLALEGHGTLTDFVLVKDSGKEQEFTFRLEPLVPKALALLAGVHRYDGNVPDFLHAEPDVEMLAGLMRAGGFPAEGTTVLTQSRGKEDPKGSPSVGELRRHLKKLAEEARTLDTVVVALFGRVMQPPGETEPFFMPAQADSGDKESLLPVREVLEHLGRCKAKRKVLLLDGWRKVPDGGADRRAAEWDGRSLNGTLLFASCARGQLGIDQPRRRHGAFGYALARGLTGQADTDADGKVTLAELAIFVNREVAAVCNLAGSGIEQTPELLGNGVRPQEFVMTRTTKGAMGFGKGWTSLDAKDYARAVETFEAAAKSLPDFPQLLVKRAEARFYSDQAEAAREDCRRALELDARFALAHSHLGDLLAVAKDFDGALAEHRQAIDLEPRYGPAYVDRAVVLTLAGKAAEAKKDLDEAVRLDPGSARAYRERAGLAVNQGDFDQGLADLTKAAELSPRDPEVLIRRAALHRRMKNYERAVEDYAGALKIDEAQPKVWNSRGVLLVQLKRPDEAIRDFGKAVDLDPKYKEAFRNLGLVHLRKEQYDLAIHHLSRAIAIDDRYAAAHNDLAAAYLRRFEKERNGEDQAKAREHMKKAKELMGPGS